MPTGLYLSILKLFITPLGSIATATICLLTTLKNCMRGYVLCWQLSWQNFSFYFVLNLDTGPYQVFSYIIYSRKYKSTHLLRHICLSHKHIHCDLNISHCDMLFHLFLKYNNNQKQIFLYQNKFLFVQIYCPVMSMPDFVL